MIVDWQRFLHQLLATAAFAAVGLVFFVAAFVAITRMLPFSVRKEIEEDQNTALGVVLGSVILGMAIIIAAAVHGG